MLAKAVKERWILILVLAAFVIAKIPVLHYPFFWDESWSYEPGVQLMYEQGPSLMPNAIDTFYSRGHPLLFYASSATWMHTFGPSHTSQHSFALLVSVLLLIAVYESGLRLFSKNVAILALLLVAGQVIFFVQSTMVLPEVMVTLFTVLSIWFYAARKYWPTFLALTALLYTKESGFTLGLVLGAHAVYTLFNKEEIKKHKIANFMAVLGAGLTIGCFYLLQRKLNGWFLFPMHESLLNLSWSAFQGKMRFCCEVIFLQQLRVWLFLLLIVCGMIAAFKTKNFRFSLPLLTGLLLFIFIGSHFGYITRRLFIPFIFASLVHTVFTIRKADTSLSVPGSRFITLALFFLGVYLSFTSINFLTTRYLLTAITVLLIVMAWCFDFFTRLIGKVFPFLVADCIIILLFSLRFNSKVSDTDMGVYAAMEVQQKVVDYLETNNLYDRHIFTGSYLDSLHLCQPLTGFRHTTRKFTNVSDRIGPQTEFLVTNNLEADANRSIRIPADSFKQVFSASRGEASAAVYSRK